MLSIWMSVKLIWFPSIWEALNEMAWLRIPLNYHKILCLHFIPELITLLFVFHLNAQGPNVIAIDFDLFNIAAADLAIFVLTWVH